MEVDVFAQTASSGSGEAPKCSLLVPVLEQLQLADMGSAQPACTHHHGLEMSHMGAQGFGETL